ncbi:MAG: glycosyltransferase [Aliidongia sp.]
MHDLIARPELPGILFVTIGHGDIGAFDFPAGRLLELGPVGEPERLAEIYAAADVLVSPSTEETFGQVFVEAIACGTPVIGHGVTGVAEAVRDGITGLLTAGTTADDLDARSAGTLSPARSAAGAGRMGGGYTAKTNGPMPPAITASSRRSARTGLADRLGLPA